MTDIENDILEKEIIKAIKARGLKEAMEQWDKELLEEKRRKTKVLRISLTAVAVAAMFIGVLFVPFTTDTATTTRSKAGNIEQVYTGFRSADAAAEQLGNTEKLLVAGNFTEAVASAEEVLSLLESDEPLSVQQREMKEDAEWYLTLSHLSTGRLWDYIQGIRLLKTIAAQDGIHSAEAVSMLKELGK